MRGRALASGHTDFVFESLCVISVRVDAGLGHGSLGRRASFIGPKTAGLLPVEGGSGVSARRRPRTSSERRNLTNCKAEMFENTSRIDILRRWRLRASDRFGQPILRAARTPPSRSASRFAGRRGTRTERIAASTSANARAARRRLSPEPPPRAAPLRRPPPPFPQAAAARQCASQDPQATLRLVFVIHSSARRRSPPPPPSSPQGLGHSIDHGRWPSIDDEREWPFWSCGGDTWPGRASRHAWSPRRARAVDAPRSPPTAAPSDLLKLPSLAASLAHPGYVAPPSLVRKTEPRPCEWRPGAPTTTVSPSSARASATRMDLVVAAVGPYDKVLGVVSAAVAHGRRTDAAADGGTVAGAPRRRATEAQRRLLVLCARAVDGLWRDTHHPPGQPARRRDSAAESAVLASAVVADGILLCGPRPDGPRAADDWVPDGSACAAARKTWAIVPKRDGGSRLGRWHPWGTHYRIALVGRHLVPHRGLQRRCRSCSSVVPSIDDEWRACTTRGCRIRVLIYRLLDAPLPPHVPVGGAPLPPSPPAPSGYAMPRSPQTADGSIALLDAWRSVLNRYGLDYLSSRCDRQYEMPMYAPPPRHRRLVPLRRRGGLADADGGARNKAVRHSRKAGCRTRRSRGRFAMTSRLMLR